jgi:hypothetical protein
VTASIDDEVVFAHCDVCFRCLGWEDSTKTGRVVNGR